ncbi:MAG: hypothetical protein Q4B47_01545 [Eubacteriales bacterium]|nr:hypothetical protein [Eubacteriales bacterium]
MAKNDFAIFKELYDADLAIFDKVFEGACTEVIQDYQNVTSGSKMYNARIRDRICELSATLAKANSWEISHGGMTGRTAQQFIDNLLGSM